MKLRNQTIKIIAETISGDNEISKYRSGPKLVDFFNELGFNDVYAKGFPTRRLYAEEKIKEIVNNNEFTKFLDYALSEEHYVDINSFENETQNKIVELWNKYLKLDNYEIKWNGKWNLMDISSAIIVVNEEQLKIISTEFMNEQISKCDYKISVGDYDGAITNARSMIEEVLLAIEEEITGERGKNDGDINKIYSRVKKLLNIDPSQKGLYEPLKQILSGLNSIVTGVGRLRSKASDSHAREYKPSKHHAVLAVNSAKTFIDFIISSYNYQYFKKIL